MLTNLHILIYLYIYIGYVYMARYDTIKNKINKHKGGDLGIFLNCSPSSFWCDFVILKSFSCISHKRDSLIYCYFNKIIKFNS